MDITLILAGVAVACLIVLAAYLRRQQRMMEQCVARARARGHARQQQRQQEEQQLEGLPFTEVTELDDRYDGRGRLTEDQAARIRAILGGHTLTLVDRNDK